MRNLQARAAGIADGRLQPIAHGYTVTELDRVARGAARIARWRHLAFDERTDLARFAIVEHLLTASETPEPQRLMSIGVSAINTHVDQDGRYRGVRLTRNGAERATAMPRFWRYWTSATQPTRSPEDHILDVHALTQIWPQLTRPHKTVLLALATHDNHQQAAASLGRPYHSYLCTLSTARQQFWRLWHQDETPRRMWGNDRRSQHRAETDNSITVVTIRRRKQRRAKTATDAGQTTPVGALRNGQGTCAPVGPTPSNRFGADNV